MSTQIGDYHHIFRRRRQGHLSFGQDIFPLSQGNSARLPVGRPQFFRARRPKRCELEAWKIPHLYFYFLISLEQGDGSWSLASHGWISWSSRSLCPIAGIVLFFHSVYVSKVRLRRQFPGNFRLDIFTGKIIGNVQGPEWIGSKRIDRTCEFHPMETATPAWGKGLEFNFLPASIRNYFPS